MRTRPRDKNSEKNVVVQDLGSYPYAGPYRESISHAAGIDLYCGPTNSTKWTTGTT
jgi:hypothetical protein